MQSGSHLTPPKTTQTLVQRPPRTGGLSANRFVQTHFDSRVASSLDTIRRLLPPNISFRTSFCSGNASMAEDDGALSLILVRLCANAKEAMPEGGTLEVATSRWLRGDNAGGGLRPWVCVSVMDTGKGIPKSQQPRLFAPFFTTKTRTGAGLGLSAVYEAVRRLNGFIEVESEPGRGSVFSIFFPELESRQERTPDLENGKMILVVDDEPTIRRVLKRILTRSGYEVMTCINGEDALECFRQNRDQIAMVVTDSMMPKMGGLELYQAVTQQEESVPFLFCSGYTAEEFSNSFFEVPNRAWLSKPFSNAQLLKSVAGLLTTRSTRHMAHTAKPVRSIPTISPW